MKKMGAREFRKNEDLVKILKHGQKWTEETEVKVKFIINPYTIDELGFEEAFVSVELYDEGEERREYMTDIQYEDHPASKAKHHTLAKNLVEWFQKNGVNATYEKDVFY